MKTSLHLPGPQPPGCTIFGDFFKEVVVGVKEERQPGRETVHLQTIFYSRLYISQSVVQSEGQFLHGCGAGFSYVIAAYADRVKLGDHLHTILYNIIDDL
jgi:hypothetical protein